MLTLFYIYVFYIFILSSSPHFFNTRKIILSICYNPPLQVHIMEDTSPVCAQDRSGAASSPYAIAARRIAMKKRGSYVNLLDNPESFTGYSGESATKVWRAIQEENCFSDGGYSGVATDNASGQCLEKRVFYRLMSGMQASISTHIAKEYVCHFC